MKLLTNTCLYGIRAALLVASMEDRKKYVPIHQIADELGISFSFLTKILRSLTHAKIFVSCRGPNGGVLLARPAETITLMDIIGASDCDGCLEGCVLGLPKCDERLPCPLHEDWQGTGERIRAVFEKNNLAELAQKFKEGGIRLAR